VITTLLIKVNTATQMAIVDQQYARAQVLFLTYNNAEYPELRLRTNVPPQDIMLMGVAENVAPPQTEGRNYLPAASVQDITRPRPPIGNNDKKTEPKLRGKIRLHNNVVMCTQFSDNFTSSTEFAFCRSPYK